MNRGVVHRQKAKGVVVVHPHGRRIPIEQQPVPLLENDRTVSRLLRLDRRILQVRVREIEIAGEHFLLGRLRLELDRLLLELRLLLDCVRGAREQFALKSHEHDEHDQRLEPEDDHLAPLPERIALGATGVEGRLLSEEFIEPGPHRRERRHARPLFPADALSPREVGRAQDPVRVRAVPRRDRSSRSVAARDCCPGLLAVSRVSESSVVLKRGAGPTLEHEDRGVVGDQVAAQCSSAARGRDRGLARRRIAPCASAAPAATTAS